MKHLKIFALCVICAGAVGCQKANKYTLNATVPTDWDGGMAYLAHYDGRDLLMDDSARIDKGAFVLKNHQDTVVYRLLLLKKDGNREFIAPVIVEGGHISVAYNGRNATIGGTPQNEILQQYLDIEQQFAPQMDSLFVAYMKADESDTELQHAIEMCYDSLDAEAQRLSVAFVEANTDNAAGAYAFVQNYRSLSDEQQSAIVDKAGENFLCQPGVAPIVERLELTKKVAVGKPFADFAMYDLNGNEVRLSQFVGNSRYLVVDFWASWCRPCRQSMPELKAIYKKYGAKIDIVGVSFDSDKAAWEKCVADLELPWHHISDLKGWHSAAAQIYGIDAIPHLMLIDPDGNIVAKKLNDQSLAEKLEELLQ